MQMHTINYALPVPMSREKSYVRYRIGKRFYLYQGTLRTQIIYSRTKLTFKSISPYYSPSTRKIILFESIKLWTVISNF